MFFENEQQQQPAFGWAAGPAFGRGPRGGWGFGRGQRGEPRDEFGPGQHGPWGHGFGRGPHGGPGFFGMFGMFGPGSRGGRGPQMFGRGDLKFVLLSLINERPKHGYEMIKELEDRAGGFYTPSAGAIYPTLQLMEDRGWLTSAVLEGKKVYTITEAGSAALRERGEHAFGFEGQRHGPGRHEHGPEHHEHGPHHDHGPERHEHESHHGHRHGARPFFMDAPPELGDLGRESVETAMLLREAVMRSAGDSDRLAKLRAIISQTRAALQAFIAAPAPAAETPPAATDAPAKDGPVTEV